MIVIHLIGDGSSPNLAGNKPGYMEVEISSGGPAPWRDIQGKLKAAISEARAISPRPIVSGDMIQVPKGASACGSIFWHYDAIESTFVPIPLDVAMSRLTPFFSGYGGGASPSEAMMSFSLDEILAILHGARVSMGESPLKKKISAAILSITSKVIVPDADDPKKKPEPGRIQGELEL